VLYRGVLEVHSDFQGKRVASLGAQVDHERSAAGFSAAV